MYNIYNGLATEYEADIAFCEVLSFPHPQERQEPGASQKAFC